MKKAKKKEDNNTDSNDSTSIANMKCLDQYGGQLMLKGTEEKSLNATQLCAFVSFLFAIDREDVIFFDGDHAINAMNDSQMGQNAENAAEVQRYRR